MEELTMTDTPDDQELADLEDLGDVADLEDLDPGELDEYARERANTPVVAVVGRPNVGKSTLVNRILGTRQAVVQDVPGVTRDRVTYDASWRGRAFPVLDTGGWESAEEGSLAARVADQAKV